MSYVPTQLATLRDELHDATGLSFVSLGIVGDTRHRSGYHLGKDRIFSSTGQGWTDYSVKTTRDKAGLSNAASAIDIGNFPRLRQMSVWLVERCQANAAGTSDIREVIYSPDGQRVLRYDRQRGIQSEPRTGEADNSHLTHTHVSFYRDSETRDKWRIFAPFFQEGPVAIFIQENRRGHFSIPAGRRVSGYSLSGETVRIAKTWENQPASGADFVAVLRRTSGESPTPLLKVSEGFFAGLYVPTGQVDETFDPVPLPAPDPAKLAEAKSAGFREAKSKASLAVNNITEG